MNPNFTLFLYNFTYRFDLISQLSIGTGAILSFEIRRTEKVEEPTDDKMTFADIIEEFESSSLLEFLISLACPYTLVPGTLTYQVIVEDDDNAFIRIQCRTSNSLEGVPDPKEIPSTFDGGLVVTPISHGVTATVRRTFTQYLTAPMQVCEIEISTSLPKKGQGHIFIDKRMDYVSLYKAFIRTSLGGMYSTAVHFVSDHTTFKKTIDPFIKFNTIFQSLYTATSLYIKIFFFPKEVFGYPVSWALSPDITKFTIGTHKTKDVTREGVSLNPEWFQLAVGTVRPQTLPLTASVAVKTVIQDSEQYLLYDDADKINFNGRTVANFTLVERGFAVKEREHLAEYGEYSWCPPWTFKMTHTQQAEARLKVFSINNQFAGLPDIERAYGYAVGIMVVTTKSPYSPELITPTPIPDDVAKSFIPQWILENLCRVYELDVDKLYIQLKPISYYPTEIRYLLEANIDAAKLSMNPESKQDIINKEVPKPVQQPKQAPKKGFLNFLNPKK